MPMSAPNTEMRMDSTVIMRPVCPRPNPIALAVVELLAAEAGALHVRGLDCLDGTPLLDIKPYFASTDAKPDARVGWHERRN